MWKVLLLGLYVLLAVRGLAKGAPFQPEDKWKPLDNPRNRDLGFGPGVQLSHSPCGSVGSTNEQDTVAALLTSDAQAMDGVGMSELGYLHCIRTLQAYFSGRGLDLRKFPATFTVNNEGPRLYSDPIASAFADYEEKKKSFQNYFKG